MKKPIICFFMGYVPDYTVVNRGAYGAEIATKNLTEALVDHFDVYVFGMEYEEKNVNGVRFRDYKNLEEFSKKNQIEAMIVSRYLFYLLDFDPKKIAKKTFFWSHDLYLSQYVQGKELPNLGKDLLKKNISKIDGFICLSNWHKKEFLDTYEFIEPKKVFVIGNAINLKDFEGEVIKDESRFVWFQHPDRGLFELIDLFPSIREIIPDATLYIYGGEEYFEEHQIQIQDYLQDHMYYGGKLDNKHLIREIKKATYWFYPLNMYETYCIAALEAQLAGLMCIATNNSGLKETISDRGILFDTYKEALSAIKKVHFDEELRRDYVKKAKDFAMLQTWKKRAIEWKKVIESP